MRLEGGRHWIAGGGVLFRHLVRELREGLTGHPVGGGERGIAKRGIRQERTWTKSRAYVCSTCSFRSEVFDAEGVRQSGAVFVPPSLFQGYLDNLRAVDSELSRPAARPWLPASFFFERGLLCVLNCMWPPKSLLAANSRRDCWGGQLGLPRQLLRFAGD